MKLFNFSNILKSLKGNYQGFGHHTNSHDIDTITICCVNLIQDNISIIIIQEEKDIKSVSNRRTSIKKRREILSNPQVGSGIFTLLAGTILPAIISTFL